MRRVVFFVCAVVAATGLGSARASAALPVFAGQCGIPKERPVWGEYGWPSLLPILAKPGTLLAVTTSVSDYPAEARAAGAATYFFDVHMSQKVGTPTAPADPSTIAAKAKKEYDWAVGQTGGCTTPVVIENELFGAGTATPWTASNAQYRANVLALLTDLNQLGAHPILLVNNTPYTAGDALQWWLAVAGVADIVRETYMPATQVWKAGPVLGSRMLRQFYRRALNDFTSIGIPPNRLGLMISFSTTRGNGGRNGLEPDEAWFEVVKWEALAAKTVAADTGAGSVWSWGWAMWNAAENDPAKAKAACVWLWARSTTLCDAPAMLGSSFDASLTEGQIDLRAGVVCSVPGGGSITLGALRSLQVLTGDRDAAMSALFERAVEGAAASVSGAAVLAAERVVIATSFHGSRAAYVAALRQAHANVSIARAILGDELRQATIEAGLRAPAPSEDDVRSFYTSYPQLLVRLVQASPAPAWLGGKKRGLALSEVAPGSLFTLPPGKKATIETLAGPYSVKPLGASLPLGAIPFSSARAAIAAALRSFARGQAFEAWTIARQHGALNQTTCLRDQLPQPAAVDLAEYLPFLRIG